jgi:hypothetical protein
VELGSQSIEQRGHIIAISNGAKHFNAAVWKKLHQYVVRQRSTSRVHPPMRQYGFLSRLPRYSSASAMLVAAP